jgi:hypothetical protein
MFSVEYYACIMPTESFADDYFVVDLTGDLKHECLEYEVDGNTKYPVKGRNLT